MPIKTTDSTAWGAHLESVTSGDEDNTENTADESGFDHRSLTRMFGSTNDGTRANRIRFIFLGDLLDIMAHRALSSQNFLSTEITTDGTNGSFGSSQMIKILAGPVRLYIEGIADPVRCSLSDIPIAVEEFADFWFNNVIRAGKEQYSLVDFIRDIAAQLIGKAFGDSCAEGTSKSIIGENRGL